MKCFPVRPLQGFKKVDPDKWEFANGNFLRGQNHLLNNIVRRRQQGKSGTNPEPVLEEAEEMAQEITRLKCEQRSLDEVIRSMSKRLEATERRPHQVMSFLNRVIDDPGLVSRIFLEKEKAMARQLTEKKKRLEMPSPSSSSPSSSSSSSSATSIGAPTSSDSPPSSQSLEVKRIVPMWRNCSPAIEALTGSTYTTVLPSPPAEGGGNVSRSLPQHPEAGAYVAVPNGGGGSNSWIQLGYFGEIMVVAASAGEEGRRPPPPPYPFSLLGDG
ncbi:hypothetical protein MLD38_006265 [Melastoma candidum]|uniref:Uncharacterized protein n=1 Tax=Melastoma candidum TaxID=119954 RepID=A0ACB9RME7_9MYRT|nr:hypothetical protein MLD38_006265 [Melastoma candidum]